MECSSCGNNRYAGWCPYCDTETPPLGWPHVAKRSVTKLSEVDENEARDIARSLGQSDEKFEADWAEFVELKRKRATS